MSDDRGGNLRFVGFGAAACAASCAGPILAALGGLTVAGLASTIVIGLAGVAIGVVSFVGLMVVRRRRGLDRCAATVDVAPVELRPREEIIR